MTPGLIEAAINAIQIEWEQHTVGFVGWVDFSLTPATELVADDVIVLDIDDELILDNPDSSAI